MSTRHGASSAVCSRFDLGLTTRETHTLSRDRVYSPHNSFSRLLTDHGRKRARLAGKSGKYSTSTQHRFQASNDQCTVRAINVQYTVRYVCTVLSTPWTKIGKRSVCFNANLIPVFGTFNSIFIISRSLYAICLVI